MDRAPGGVHVQDDRGHLVVRNERLEHRPPGLAGGRARGLGEHIGPRDDGTEEGENRHGALALGRAPLLLGGRHGGEVALRGCLAGDTPGEDGGEDIEGGLVNGPGGAERFEEDVGVAQREAPMGYQVAVVRLAL